MCALAVTFSEHLWPSCLCGSSSFLSRSFQIFGRMAHSLHRATAPTRSAVQEQLLHAPTSQLIDALLSRVSLGSGDHSFPALLLEQLRLTSSSASSPDALQWGAPRFDAAGICSIEIPSDTCSLEQPDSVQQPDQPHMHGLPYHRSGTQ